MYIAQQNTMVIRLVSGPKINQTYKIYVSFLLSLILIISGCQTASTTGQSEPAGTLEKEDFKTSLSVAASFLDGGRPDKAMHELAPNLEKYPNNISVLSLMGISQLALSNPKRAALHFEKAWKLSPSSATAVNLSSAYLELNKLKEAEKVLTNALTLKEMPAYQYRERLFHNYGLVADRTDRPLLAEKMYQKSVELNPMFHLSHMQLSRLYKEKRKIALATKHLESARFACPSCFEPLEALVKIQLSNRKINVAKQLIQDFKLTEGLSQLDRRRVNELESNLTQSAQKVTPEAPTKNR